MAFTVPVLERLVEVTGSQDKPVKNISITSVGFRDAAATFMNPHWSAPSGGDWSLHRGGALFIEGAENVTVAEYVLCVLAVAVFHSTTTPRGDNVANNAVPSRRWIRL